ncbi:MAG: hypothetical protein IIZ38_04685 [Sphingomonas sp.]|uniref:hypothetical protein n=1 Tax=Sphingomonas sp. TaxID=28214 RepID=UPI0025F4560A|nr:hypothetical protein [Sphingomonas sp.]MBQ1497592.1 hypothetical protein [Sphingomonas sp.]
MSSLFPALFQESPPPGIEQAKNIPSPDEEAELIRSIDATRLAPFRLRQWQGKRLTRSFGRRYDFTDSSFTETEAVPDWLMPLRTRAAALAGLEADAPVQVSQFLPELAPGRETAAEGGGGGNLKARRSRSAHPCRASSTDRRAGISARSRS